MWYMVLICSNSDGYREYSGEGGEVLKVVDGALEVCGDSGMSE